MNEGPLNIPGKGSLAPGTMLDHYRLGKCLGVGGMGEVYYAVHEVLQTPCAIKIIRPEIAKGSPDVAARLIREARMACRIQHDNIVGVLDASSTSSLGCPYIVMEYVDGVSVEQYLKSGPMPEEDVVAIALSVTEALIAAAKYKVVHRDIKPANIMINSRGQVKLADLGIAKSDTSLTMGVTLTRENAVLGTPNYAAPEQLRSSHTVDARADIYSLGATMYHLLSGRRPFEGDTVFNVIAKVVCETLPTFKELGVNVSPALEELIGKMMAKDPEQRPASALELKRMLLDVKKGKVKHRFRLPTIPKPVLLVLAFALAAGACGLFGFRLFNLLRQGEDVLEWRPPAAFPARTADASGTQPPAAPGTQPSAAPGTQPSAAPRAPHPALVILLPGGVKLEMVKIKAGSFMMGSPENELGHAADEKQHRVTLTKDYWLGKFEGTQGQWRAVMENDPLRFGKGDDYPVALVSWDDVKMFCGKLNELYAKMLPQGYRFDLPTEAQWEYACRAGTTAALNSGKDLTSEEGTCRNLDEVGWYHGNSGRSTHPVGRKRPNAWGLYDMHGNVRELCRDRSSYHRDAADPIGSGPFRASRGGSWFHHAKSCRSASRFAHVAMGPFLGFRLALVPIQSRSPAAAPTAASAPESSSKAEFPLSVSLPDNVKLTMVKIKAGSFMMGSPVSELGHNGGERQHRVTLTKDFWLGKYEVTQGQWKSVMGNNPSYFKKGDDYPVEKVLWDDAKRFCDKLNELHADKLPRGYRFDLPTEAQWEYACRAGTTAALNSGKRLTSPKGPCPNLDELGWYHGNSGLSTHPVGRKRPNAWGLYDMHGNVWEWCRDRSPYPRDVTDPIGSGPFRASRGGSWLHPAQLCRSASRLAPVSPGGTPRSFAGPFLGFRLALVPVQ